VLCACLTAGRANASDGRVAGEYEVKAAFVFNFLRFVERPESDSESVEQPFVIAILGDNPFGNAIQRLSTRTVQGRAVEVRHCRSAEEARQCAVLFVCASETHRLDTILRHLEDRPVLVIGDTTGFAEAGGIVELYIEGTQVRFRVNLDAAEQAGLKISSKLLRLAKIVRGGRTSRLQSSRDQTTEAVICRTLVARISR